MLCNWKPGDIISAHHLNQMTCAINANTSGLDELGNIVSDKGSSSFSGSGGIDMGAFTGTGLESCISCLNRGYFRSGWEYSEAGESKKGLYVNKSGVENALLGEYPSEICSVCLNTNTSGLGEMDIMIKTTTDCYGKVLSQCIYTQAPTSGSGENPSNALWQGPSESSASSPEGYSFTRRIGRITDDTTHPISSCSSTYYNKVLNTNDLVMPILPARGEKEEYSTDKHSVSLIGNFKDNSVIIKNISNGGGLKFENNSAEKVKVTSGVEFFAAEPSDSTEDEENNEVTFPPITPHIEPGNFDITVACIPVKEQHYNWCKATSSWVPVTSGDSIEEGEPTPEEKGSIVIRAKTLENKPWQIGWSYKGEIEIPVKDFTPSEGVAYEAGRGISICEQNVNTGTEEDPVWGSKNVICNTMEICAGCGISVEQTDTEKPAYKINACKLKMEAGDGIKVECITGGYKISACAFTPICITSGAGISVTKSDNTYTITNTAMHDAVEVVAGDGICVVQTGNKYKVSIASSESSEEIPGYSFDPAWFTVTGNNVTLNETKINTVATTLAKNISSQITSTTSATIDTWTDDTGYAGYSGEIIAEINTTSGCTATANIRSVSS